ncbi:MULTISPECIES: tol-pal system-associated acyl-CoA thioesterase [unclassified Luteimonas]|uniref:tol-pal system-associated acyl-CoA thioesterase n=1 Tax=unclassified Luteimonas TaxID=2629088 RepID=UPI0018F066CB|nr:MULTISPECIES: tol-pal system-associated acyl-CoA thioesterase [unclassified Luteimonas]MBJ6981333.1 tol-pal system-associated acyl-CoA thioesterase [Luteimonas sp. MC1572]MBJ7576092.1 tol-pal system-associated acyl-CoA thioesterase [Luteimonas sp. MC1828]QQO02649.1 tol-pal system-associated acyl-CoA thioesterase [Luteimonas sp. MC1572]
MTSAVCHPFSLATRVYWEDTDAGGVVYHARYVAYFERARSDWMRALGHGQRGMRDQHDLVFAVRDMQLDFHRPARLDDALQVTVAVAELRRASVVFTQEVRRDGELLVAARVRVAALDAGGFRPRAIPDHLYLQLKPLESNAEQDR